MRWIVSFLLVYGYFGVYTEEVWIGFGSVCPFVWIPHLFWFILRIVAWLDETDGFIAIPQWARWIVGLCPSLRVLRHV